MLSGAACIVSGTPKHARTDLLTAMRTMLTGQVLRPGYAWLLRYHPYVLLEEARSRIDPAGFARLRVHFDATGRRNPQDRREALNRITWILLSKGGLVRDITIGDCIELDERAAGAPVPGGQQPAPVLYAAGRDRRAPRRRPADPESHQDDRPAHPRRARRQVRPRRTAHAGTVHFLPGRAGRRARLRLPGGHGQHVVRPVLAGPGAASPGHRLAGSGHRGCRRLEGQARAGYRSRRTPGSATGPTLAASC